MTIRTLHRWLSIVVGLFMIFMGVTGTILALDNVWGVNRFALRLPAPTDATAETGEAAARLAPAPDIDAYLQTALAAAVRESGGAALRSISLSATREHPVARVSYAGPIQRTLTLDARTGEVLAARMQPAQPQPTLHGIVEWLHRGAFAGWPGVIIVTICGLGLILLGVTGVWIYLDMFRRRASNGRHAFFWQ